MLYRLKYKSDQTVTDTIVEVLAGFIRSWGIKPDIILPVLPSKQRAFQPVLELARGLAAKLSLALCVDCISKIKPTSELKNLYEYDKRLAALENAFVVDVLKVKGMTILLFDDLFRSGATLNALTQALYVQGEAANVYALAITKTRSTL